MLNFGCVFLAGIAGVLGFVSIDVLVSEPAPWFFRSYIKRKSKPGGLPNLYPSVALPRRPYSVGMLAEALMQSGKYSEEGEAQLVAETLYKEFNEDIPKILLPPLHFIGQIDLEELPALPMEASGPALPNTGMLFFLANLQIDTVAPDYFRMHWVETEVDLSSDTRVLYAETMEPNRKAPDDLPANVEADDWRAQEYSTEDRVFRGAFLETPLATKQIITGGPFPDVQKKGGIISVLKLLVQL